ncbi:fructose-bisphosphate aldolase [bacterium]|nr:fructose-bisphosphate aldolase [bacterium]
MSLGKKLRGRRLWKNGRTVVVPLDHPLYFGPLPGVEDPVALVRTAAEAGADAVLVSPGTLELVADVLGDMAVLLRIDGTHTRLGQHLERIDLISSVEEAARMGVEAVALNIYVGADNEDALLAKLARVAQDCRQYGLLLVGEMIPAPLLAAHYGRERAELTDETKTEYIALAARVGAEIGADVLKLNYSGSRDSFASIVRKATRPILVAGGIKSGDDQEFLQSVREAMRAGAAGVCIGRNVWQRPDVSAMIGALSAIVHDQSRHAVVH